MSVVHLIEGRTYITRCGRGRAHPAAVETSLDEVTCRLCRRYAMLDSDRRHQAVQEQKDMPEDTGPTADRDAADLPEEAPAAALERLQRELNVASGQRDFLVGQVDSLIQRLAGAHVAAGSFNMAAAQGFTQKEVMPINAVLAQIVQANAPQAET